MVNYSNRMVTITFLKTVTSFNKIVKVSKYSLKVGIFHSHLLYTVFIANVSHPPCSSLWSASLSLTPVIN